MKFTLLFSLILLTSCGVGPENTETGNLGQIRSVVIAPASSALKSAVSGLCQSLRDKEANFRFFYLQSNSVFNFNTSYKSCTNNPLSSQVKVKLYETVSGLQLNPISGDYFYTGLETATNGQMSVLCSDVNNLNNPMMLPGSSNVIWFDFLPQSLCDNGNAFTKCLRMEIGIKQTSGQHFVTVTNIYDVSLNAGNLTGMVKNFTSVDLSSCTGGNRVERSVKFTGVTAN